MKERIIGILGGMGPEATLDCYAKIIQNTPAGKDQDHLQVIINSDPKVPDRTAAILGRGESPLPALITGVQTLERAGAEFVIRKPFTGDQLADTLTRAIEARERSDRGRTPS